MQNATINGMPWWKLDFKVIGQEKTPLLIIDNFHPTPSLLQDEAEQSSFAKIAPYYPGERAAIKSPYLEIVMQGLQDPLMKIFGYKEGAKVQECFYSKLTTPPDELNMVQRIPHVDGGDDRKIALLHYLCGPEFGGTAFYKQVSTGFETVPNIRFEEFSKAVTNDHETLGPPEAQYFVETDKRFEKIAEVEAKFNRAVMYFGFNLHAITPGKTDFSKAVEKPMKAINTRLTVNTFIGPTSKLG